MIVGHGRAAAPAKTTSDEGEGASMKAVVVTEIGARGGAASADFPDPVPGAGGVLMDVEEIETNYPDMLVGGGRYQPRPPVPFVPGKGAAGRVAALGTG